MKLISLNCYMGHEFEPLIDFLIKEAPTTDVFCLQEMQSNPKGDLTTLPRRGRANLLQEIQKRLSNFHCEFSPVQDDFDILPAYPGQMQLGIVTFYKKSLPVTQKGSFFIYNSFNTYRGLNDWETLGHAAVYIALDGVKPITIVNVHGNSQPSDKRDTTKRLAQSLKVIDFLASRQGEKIVMGDFNLFPDTHSIQMFEQAGYQNLIRDYKITTTRGSNLRKLFPEYANNRYGWQEFADYTFVSAGITVTRFDVPDVPVSDHLPMILEIDRVTLNYETR